HGHWGCIGPAKGQPRWERLRGCGVGDKWSDEDSKLPARFRAALSGSAHVEPIDALAKKLEAQRVAPLSKHLGGVKRLFVAPVGQMAGIPLEAITDQFMVSY